MSTELSINRAAPLTRQEQMELVAASTTRGFQIVYKLLELMVIEERDLAARIDPADKKAQRAAWTTAHAMLKMYDKFKQKVEEGITEHRDELAKKAAEELAKERDEIGGVIAANIPYENTIEGFAEQFRK